MLAPACTQTERNVLERTHVGEQQMVLEHDADGSRLGRDERVGVGIVEHVAIDRDPAPVDREEPPERTQQRRLARAVRSEHGEHLTGLDGEFHVELERSEPHTDRGVEAHASAARAPPSQRSRSPMRTANETAIISKLMTRASFGSVSSAR